VRYRFGQFELDAARYELSHAGELVAVQPKVFELLRYLVEHPDRLLTQRELRDALWAGQSVTETVLPWTVRQARKILSQKASERGPIETVHARGYRWRGPLEVLDAVSQPPDEQTERRDAPFVGRAPLMAAMDDVVRKLQSGRGGLLLLVGDAGIGKTRCLEELAMSARAQGYDVWKGRGLPDTTAPVYGPFVQALRVAEVIPQLRPRLTALLRRFESAPAERLDERSAVMGRLALFEAVQQFLHETGRHKPCVLLLDDLHWADSGTVEMISFIAAQLRQMRVLIIAASRAPLGTATAQGVEAVRHAQRYDLSPLNEQDIAEYWRAVVDESGPTADLCAALQRSSAGYPLFLEETLRDLLARHPRSELKNLEASAIAPSQHARELLNARLAAMPKATRTVLGCASVVGDAFDLLDLVQVCGVAADVQLQALQHALQSHFIHAQAGERFAFRHALFREVVYDQVPLSERLRLHRATAHVLQARPDAGTRRSEIARHYQRSLALGEPASVCAAAMDAARAASNAASYADAAEFSAWALQALALNPDASQREYAELLVFRAYAQRCAGSPEEARSTLDLAVEVAASHGYADLLVRAARALRLSHGMGVVPDALARRALERVLELCRGDTDALRIQALSMLSWLPPDSYDLQRSKQLSEHALELARRVDQHDALAEALTARLYALSGPNDIGELLALSEEIFALDSTKFSWLQLEALTARHVALLQRGDQAGARAAVETLRSVADERGYLDVRWHCDRHGVQSLIASGDFVAAHAGLAKLEAEAVRIRLGMGAGIIDTLRSLITTSTQKPAAALDHHALARYRAQIGMAQLRTTNQTSILKRHLDLGRTEEARAGLHALAADSFAQVPENVGYLYSMCTLAQIAISLAEREHAEQLFERLQAYKQLDTVSEYAISQGPVSFYLALLARYLGDNTLARNYFECALTRAEQSDQMPQLARIHLEIARSCSGRALRAHSARATELAERLGMAWLREQAEALAESSGTP
jgi:DNA-binding winged helix-turn-helix (wHTH) protein